jgi:hypothetical protein
MRRCCACSEPIQERWPGLAPRVAQAIGPGRLRDIAETTRKATAGVDRIELDSSGWRVASGPGGRVLLWGRADPDGLVTSLWITADGKERHPGRAQHAAGLLLIVFSALAAGDAWSAHSRCAWAAGACWILFLALVVEGLGGPARLPCGSAARLRPCGWPGYSPRSGCPP